MSSEYKLILFYDLPIKLKEDRVRYRKFHSYIISKGFLMLQESVYVKTVKKEYNYNILRRELLNLVDNKCNIRILKVSEHVFSSMEVLSGDDDINDLLVNNESRIIDL